MGYHPRPGRKGFPLRPIRLTMGHRQPGRKGFPLHPIRPRMGYHPRPGRKSFPLRPAAASAEDGLPPPARTQGATPAPDSAADGLPPAARRQGVTPAPDSAEDGLPPPARTQEVTPAPGRCLVVVVVNSSVAPFGNWPMTVPKFQRPAQSRLSGFGPRLRPPPDSSLTSPQLTTATGGS